MKFPLLATVIVFVIWLNYEIFKRNNKAQRLDKDFWEKESRSNGVRKKSLESLSYIHIPLEALPMDVLTNNPEVSACLSTISHLSNEKIVNLTGITNTDLKLEYGTANITALSDFDQNYTVLVTTLQKWGKELYDNSQFTQAACVLEFAVSTRTDIMDSYRLLCDMYKTKLHLNITETKEKLDQLLPIALSLNSLSKESILSMINTERESLSV